MGWAVHARNLIVMTTYRLASENVPVFAFEVSVIETGIRRIAKLLQSTPGVSEVSVRRPFSPSGALVKFTFQNTSFVVCEPFGDNNRYWIGPVAPTGNSDVDITAIAQEFDRAKANKFRVFMARVLS